MKTILQEILLNLINNQKEQIIFYNKYMIKNNIDQNISDQKLIDYFVYNIKNFQLSKKLKNELLVLE